MWWLAGGVVIALLIAVTALGVGFITGILVARRQTPAPGGADHAPATGRRATAAVSAAVEIPTEQGAAEETPADDVPADDAPAGDTPTPAEQAAAQAAEAMRRDFVANVSHELKSPVTAIGLLAEAVYEAADDPGTVRAFAGKMQREAQRLGTLITEIIALSAIQGGGLHEVDVVRIDAVIADAVDRASVPATAAGIDLAVGEPSGAEVIGDRGLLTTAIGNLVDNAVHYSEPGSAVTIRQVVRRGIVDISVADQGIGIAPLDQRRVFERFFRADPARSRATGGTGLGLAIVKHVAANHHGSIRLASRVGVGTTFTLRLPLAGTAPDPELIGERVVIDDVVDGTAPRDEPDSAGSAKEEW